MTHSRPIVAAAAALAIIAGAAGGCSPADASKTPAHASARRVSVIRPHKADITRRIELPANVLALEQATAMAQVPGYLSEIRVDKGDAVKAGDVLAVISVPELDAQVALLGATLEQTRSEAKSAVAALERAKAEQEQVAAEAAKAAAALTLETSLLERTRGLRTDEAVSVQDLEVATARHEEAAQSSQVAHARVSVMAAAAQEAQAQAAVADARVDVARAALAQAQARKELATIRAPYDGRVTGRFVDRGALIAAAIATSQGAPVVTIARMDRVRVQLNVSETDVAAVHEGLDITLDVESWPGRPFNGKVVRFAHALDPASRTMLVEAELENADGALMPGMFARARLELERHEKSLAIPAEAVVLVEKKPCVWRVEGGSAHRVSIQTGIDDGSNIEVVKGLGAEDLLIVGARGLTDGLPVEPVDAIADEPARPRTEG